MLNSIEKGGGGKNNPHDEGQDRAEGQQEPPMKGEGQTQPEGTPEQKGKGGGKHNYPSPK